MKINHIPYKNYVLQANNKKKRRQGVSSIACKQIKAQNHQTVDRRRKNVFFL
jgi:hypothetical protein